jgi:holliday junction DNA helicase RuvA
MIGKLTGKVDHIAIDHLIIDVAGVGYLVFAPSRYLANLQKGDSLSLHIHTNVREDNISLFGFTSHADKEIFLELIKVSGVGAKTALAVLGILDADTICNAVLAQDKTTFTQVSGIGPKAAIRIITDLKDKVAKIGTSTADLEIFSENNLSSSGQNNKIIINDAVSALENLGYNRMQAFKAVSEIANDADLPLEEIITQSLKKLAA